MTTDDHSPGTTQQHAVNAASGDRTSFAGLYERLAPALHAWAALRISPSHRGRLDPEDVVQEVWWRAMDRFASFDPEKGAFRAWIFQIANRVLLNGFRSLYVRGHMQDGAGPRSAPVPDELAAQATSISEKAARNERTVQLLREVEQLDAEDRTLFSYCAIEGMTAGRAAMLLGVSEAAAAKRWHRLREKLRDAIGSVSDP